MKFDEEANNLYIKRLKCRYELVAKLKGKEPLMFTTSEIIKIVWGSKCPYTVAFVGRQIGWVGCRKTTVRRVYVHADGISKSSKPINVWHAFQVGILFPSL